MSKKYIWLVTIVLAISLCGMIFIQIKYYQSTAKIKEDQFILTVSKALDQAVSEMESDDEAKSILEGTSSNQVTSGVKRKKKINSKSYKIDFPANPDKHPTAAVSYYQEDKIIKTIKTELNSKSFNELLKKAQDPRYQFSNNRMGYQFQTSFLATSIARQNMSLKERIDLNSIHKLIKEKLKNNGIKLDFEFAIQSDNIFLKKSKNYFKYKQQEKYSKQLFPNDSFKNSHYIYIFFPGMHKYIIQSYTMLIPSLILSLILIMCCALTVYIIFRQKRLSKIKNDFINNMTHEFKTPISTISLASQMLRDNSVTTTASSINHMAKIINDESRRLTYQVEKVLQMAIFNEGRLKLKLKALNLHHIIENLMPNFTIRVEDKKGNTYQHLDAREDLVMLDEIHIGNLISNLLDNAIKYSKDVPEISISTRNKDKGIVISITDNGIGISKEDQKMVFERFFRVHTGNVHDVKGFGLGLSYVKRIADAHGGHVGVDSSLGKGTKFEVYLPFKK
jgi:two-component system phosphate regulon sensor histidine kinase PhoR